MARNNQAGAFGSASRAGAALPKAAEDSRTPKRKRGGRLPNGKSSRHLDENWAIHSGGCICYKIVALQYEIAEVQYEIAPVQRRSAKVQRRSAKVQNGSVKVQRGSAKVQNESAVSQYESAKVQNGSCPRHCELAAVQCGIAGCNMKLQCATLVLHRRSMSLRYGCEGWLSCKESLLWVFSPRLLCRAAAAPLRRVARAVCPRYEGAVA